MAKTYWNTAVPGQPDAPSRPDGRRAARPRAAGRAARALSILGEPALVFVLAALVRLVGLSGHVPNADDMLHFYAARSYLDDGSLTILSGTYVRAWDFTWLVAGSMALFGDSFAAARLPSLVSGALLAAAIYAWMRREAGRGPAVIAAGLMILMAPAIIQSVLVRFYALQALLFWLGTILLHRLVTATRPGPGVVALALVGLAALAEAARLQVITLIGLLGFAAWAAIYLTWRARSVVPARTLTLSWLALAAAGLVLLTALAWSGDAARLYGVYRHATWWATPSRDDALFYVKAMTRDIGPLLGFLPLVTLAALTWHPRAAFYCATVFCAAFLIHSFGGMKEQRYVGYLLPYVACLWGLGAWPLLMLLRERVLALAAPGLSSRAAARLAAPAATLAICGLAAAGAVQGVPALQQFPLSLVVPGFHWPSEEWDWAWATDRDPLRALARQADVFIVDDDLMADHYAGRADLVLNKSRLLENNPPEEFVPDFRTGTPTISADASLRSAMSCFSSGLIVVHRYWFERWLPASTVAFVAGHARALGLTPSLVGYAWSEPQGEPAADCAFLRQLVARTAGQRRAAGS